MISVTAPRLNDLFYLKQRFYGKASVSRKPPDTKTKPGEPGFINAYIITNYQANYAA